MIKLIALDLDGTVLDSRKDISEETRTAVRAARAAGVKVVVATGRIAGEAAIFARELGTDRDMIVAGGAAIADAETGKNRISKQIDPETCAAVLDRLQAEPVLLMAYADEKLYSRPEDVAEWIAGSGRTEGAAGRHIVMEDVAAAVRAERPCVNKVFVGGSPEEIGRLADTLQGTAGVHITRSGVDNIEIMPEGAHKGWALRRLAEELGIDIAETLAIGDSANDLEMLRAAGTAVAMANGDAPVLALADYVTDDNDHEGVAKAIYHYIGGKTQ